MNMQSHQIIHTFLPQSVLDMPRYGCLNIHASLLPRWRGAAPIHRAIEAGDAETGVCIMQMDAGLDTGGVVDKARLSILPTESTAQLHDRLAALGAERIVTVLQKLASGEALQLADMGALGCAVVWAVYSVTSKRMAAVPTDAVAGFCIATALLAGVTSVAFETLVMPDARQWVAILLLGAGPLGAGPLFVARNSLAGGPT